MDLLLLTFLLLPGLSLRLHHYVIALLLLPDTAIQPRPSPVYQGLLVSLLVNGIARCDFDSILQTPSESFDVDPDDLLPRNGVPQISADKIIFSLSPIAVGYNSMSVLVDDAEWYDSSKDRNLGTRRWPEQSRDRDACFRFASVKYRRFKKAWVGVYSNPGTWVRNRSRITPESTQ